MRKISKVTFLVGLALFNLGLFGAQADVVNDIRHEVSRLSRSCRKTADEVDKVFLNAAYDSQNNYDAAESIIRARDFMDEVGFYSEYISDYRRSADQELRKVYTERLNSSFVKLNKVLRRVNFYHSSFSKTERIMRNINNLVFYPTNMQTGKNSYKPVAKEKAPRSNNVDLGTRSASADKRLQWMVESKIKNVSITCTGGQAVVNTVFIDGEIRKPIMKTIKAGDVITHASDGKNTIKRIVMPVRKVVGNFTVSCTVTK